MVSSNLWKSLVRFISLEGVLQSLPPARKIRTQEVNRLSLSEEEISELSKERRARMRLQYEGLAQRQTLIDTETEAEHIS